MARLQRRFSDAVIELFESNTAASGFRHIADINRYVKGMSSIPLVLLDLISLKNAFKNVRKNPYM